MLRTMLRFDPWVRDARLHVSPLPLDGMQRLRLGNVQIDDVRIDIEWSGEGLAVDGLDGITLLREPRGSSPRSAGEPPPR
jgi:hypothetical protein